MLFWVALVGTNKAPLGTKEPAKERLVNVGGSQPLTRFKPTASTTLISRGNTVKTGNYI